MEQLHLFTTEQGTLLVRMLIAHILSDFVLQTDKMVQNKERFSPSMLIHIGIVFATTILFTGLWWISAIVTISHWLADVVKIELQKQDLIKAHLLFAADQLFHVAVLIILWAWHYDLFAPLQISVLLPFTNYQFSLLLLAYLWLIYPVGYLIKFATSGIAHTNASNSTVGWAPDVETKLQHGGKLIGRYERVIILTLVLLGHYDAIGFLITGKSIIRFADQNSNLRSEYVLVGTLMSYAVAIITGVFVTYLIAVG